MLKDYPNLARESDGAKALLAGSGDDINETTPMRVAPGVVTRILAACSARRAVQCLVEPAKVSTAL
jgi:tRNA(Ile)-lysidine synthase TilS/MesJ